MYKFNRQSSNRYSVVDGELRNNDRTAIASIRRLVPLEGGTAYLGVGG